MELTNLQRETVKKLIDVKKARKWNSVQLQAPTGCGKTLMASDFASHVLYEADVDNTPTLVVFATVSTSDLPLSVYNKFKDYRTSSSYYKNYKVTYIESPSKSNKAKGDMDYSIPARKNTIYVFGTSTFTSSSLYTQSKALEGFINDAKTKKIRVIYIRDEAHIGGVSDKLLKDSASSISKIDQLIPESYFTLRMTATPKGNFPLIEITEEDIRIDSNETGRYLLKSDLRTIEVKQGQDPLDEGIKTFKDVRNKYSKIGGAEGNINPAMLIQVNNSSKANKVIQEEFDKKLDIIEKKLSKANLTYLIYLDNKKLVGGKKTRTMKNISLEDVSKNDSPIDVIIFKVGAGTGWDIPRANMLIQIREISSETLHTQTLGRIKRNPYPNLKFNSTTNTFWVYTNFNGGLSKKATYILKQEFKSNDRIIVYNGKIDQKGKNYKENKQKFEKNFLSWLDTEFPKYLESWFSTPRWENRITHTISSSGGDNPITNKINLIRFNEYNWPSVEKKLPKETLKKLEKLANETNKNIDIIKYFLTHIKSGFWKKLQTDNGLGENTPITYKLAKSKSSDIPDDFKVSTNKKYEIDISKIATLFWYQQLNDNPDINILYVDSHPEQSLVNNIIKEYWFEEKELEHIKGFSRLPTLGNIGFEYINSDTKKVRTSYPDFIINNKKKTIYIEVKGLGEDDFSKRKTKDIEGGYKNYILNKGKHDVTFIIYQKSKELNIEQITHFDEVKGEWVEEQGGLRSVIRKKLGIEK